MVALAFEEVRGALIDAMNTHGKTKNVNRPSRKIAERARA
jgi:hypothetical protein